MYTQAKVKQIKEDGTVIMGCDTKACEGCKCSMFCNNRNQNEFTARNDRNIEVSEGDTVRLYLPPGKTILSTAMVFALPLALFPLGYIAMKSLFHTGEIVSALGGFAAMGVAFAVAAFINIKNKKKLMPVITDDLKGDK